MPTNQDLQLQIDQLRSLVGTLSAEVGALRSELRSHQYDAPCDRSAKIEPPSSD